MLILLMVLAMVSGNDDPQKPAIDTGVKRTVLPELAVGRYHKSCDLASFSRISISKKDELLLYEYKLETDDGGFIKAEGPVQFVGDRIDLIVKKMEQNRDFTVAGKRFAETRVMPFFLIKWDKRTCLVEEKELDEFCNDMNLGVDGCFFSREEVEGEGKDDNGIAPIITCVPTLAKKLLLGKPISGKVLSIEGGRAKIDLGEQDQVWKNMVLYCEPGEPEKDEMLKKGGKRGEEEYKSHRALLKVVEAHKDYCVAEIYEHQRNHNINGIRDGYKIYSRFPDSASRKGIFF
jgi:hypothetical protein